MQLFKCYIIRLKENAHSCQMAKDCKKQASLFGIETEYFKAIHGKYADEHYTKLNITKAGKFKKDRPGVLGCFLSHYYLWMQCVKENTPYIILEHDGYVITKLPDTILDQFDDVLKLDRLDPYSPSYNQNIRDEISLEFKVENYLNPSPKIKTRIGLNTNYFKGAYSYIIKPHAAQKLIDYIVDNGHVPADQQINSEIIKLQTTLPTVARLHPFYSIGSNIKQSSLTRNLKET